MRLFEQGSRPRVGIIFLIGITGFIAASIGLTLSVLYVQGSKIRQTERIIYTQGSALASTYRTVLQLHTQSSTFLGSYGKELSANLEEQRSSSNTGFKLPERKTALSQFSDPIHPPMDPPIAGNAPDRLASEVGATMMTELLKAEKVTNSTIHIIDYNGVVVASRTLENGLFLADKIGVQPALDGEHLSLLRKSSSSNEIKIVFTAVPIVLNKRLLGAIVITRKPPNPVKELFSKSSSADGDYSYPYAYGNRIAKYIIVTFLVIIVGALLFVVSITRPIRKLIRQTQQITAGSRITDINLPLPAAREIDDLSVAITNMADELRNDAAYVRNLASHVSHEFKTPISGIIGTVDVLDDDWDAIPPEKRKRFLSNISKDGERLLDLVNYLSKLATARSLKPGENDRANVNEVLESILLRNSSHQVGIESGLDNLEVKMSPELLSSIVTSLIENAKRHGGEHVKIIVNTKYNDTNKSGQLQVSNDGTLIPKENADKIFEPFFSTVRDDSRRSGSGLAYVKALLMAHGGDIVLLSNTDSVTFQLMIPVAS